MLLGRIGNLHPASAANGWVRDVTVAADLIRGVHNDLGKQRSQSLHSWVMDSKESFSSLSFQQGEERCSKAGHVHRQFVS